MKILVEVHTKAPRIIEIIEIPDEDLEGLDDEARQDLIQAEVEDVADEMIDVGWKEIRD